MPYPTATGHGRSAHFARLFGISLLAGSALAAPLLSAGARPAAPTARTAPRGAPVRAAGTAVKPAAPVAPGPDAIIPPSELKPGMKGYGLTVFKGAKIERFEVTVLGVLPAANLGKPLVLIRMSGGPITGRGAYLIQGMSGSPVYVNDRLVGAFAYGNSFAREPIGMVTPIGDMMEALDDKLPTEPAGMASGELALPPSVAAAAGGGPRLLLGPQEAALPLGTGAPTMTPIGTPVMASGFSARSVQALAQALQPFNLAVQPGGGRMTTAVAPAPQIRPGAGLGVSLITGDMDLTAVGTVTWRKGNRILAFGHPFMQIGPSNFPVSTVWVHEVMASFQSAFKIASPVRTIGTLLHDRPFSVLAQAGPAPAMIPVTCNIDDRITGKKRSFHVQVANHPLLIGQLARIAVSEAVLEAHPVPGEVTAAMNLSAETEGFGTLSRENTFYDPDQIDVACTADLTQLLGVLSLNNLRRVPLKSLAADVVLTARRPAATVERVFVKQDRFEPGETAEVGVVVRPYRGEPVVTQTRIRIPESATSGRAVLVVSGGSTRADAALLGAGQAVNPGGAGVTSTGAAHVSQLLRRFLQREKNDQLVTRLVFPTAAVSVDGVKLSQLPANLAEVMRSAKATGVRAEREEAKVVDNTDWVLAGLQMLPITIQRRDLAEKPAPPASSGGPSLGMAGLELGVGLGNGRGPLSTDDVEDLLGLLPAPARTAVPFFLPLATPVEDEDDDSPPPALPASMDKKPGPPKSEPAKPAEPKTDGKPEPKPGDAKESSAADTSLLGRAPVTWKQTSLSDFQRGTLSGMAVTVGGEVRLAPRLKPLFESTEQYVWSVISLGGAVYAGTGNGGLVYRVTPDGKASVFCRTGELEVHALASDAQGNLYAGTSPGGKVFRISPEGVATQIFALNGGPSEAQAVTGPDPGVAYVFALAVADDGAVYAGTGPEGKLYRIGPDGKASVLFTAADKSIVSLLRGPQGELYAGTGEQGLVYRVERNGRGQALFDSDQAAVTGLARDRAGNLFAATSPRGTIYKFQPDGAVSTYFDRAKTAVSAISFGADNRLYAACSNVIYRLDGPDVVTAFSDSKRAQFTAIDWDAEGRLITGSANVGAVYRAEWAAEGTFESTVHDARSIARWGRLRYIAELPTGSTIVVQTRSGNTPDPDASWGHWTNPRRDPTGTSYVASAPARYLQYRVTLRAAAAAGTTLLPALREVAVIYMPRNEPPTLTLSAPAGGEIWRGRPTLRWAGADPNKDTLTYEVYYSPDSGATWRPIGEKVVPDVPTPDAPAAPAPAGRPGDDLAQLEAAMVRYREEIALRQDLSDDARRELLRQAEQLVVAYKDQNPGGTVPKPEPRSPVEPAEKKAAPARPGVTRESSLVWDTTQLPDGLYLVKVVATDRASNPTEPLSVEKVSEPVIVVNQPPVVFVMTSDLSYTPEKQAVVVGLSRSHRISLKGAQYRVDDGDWNAIDAADGIWDSAMEPWRITTESLKPGEHTLQVKTVDAAGNAAISQANLVVP
jgi:sugar lactone lactonase YvrE